MPGGRSAAEIASVTPAKTIVVSSAPGELERGDRVPPMRSSSATGDVSGIQLRWATVDEPRR